MSSNEGCSSPQKSNGLVCKHCKDSSASDLHMLMPCYGKHCVCFVQGSEPPARPQW
jgi:hypothetical protein